MKNIKIVNYDIQIPISYSVLQILVDPFELPKYVETIYSNINNKLICALKWFHRIIKTLHDL